MFICRTHVQCSAGLLALLAVLLAPQTALAQQVDANSHFAIHILPVAIAVLFGLIASLMVIQSARKIGSGVLASVYTYLGIGMFLIVIALSLDLATTSILSDFIMSRAQDLLYVVGFAAMAYGANKLLQDVGL
jgi:predicted neutral ceramidase superfamily lipid hydrolase